MSELRDKDGLTEAEYLSTYDPDAWKKPSVTADICIVTKNGDTKSILLIQRGNHPYLGKWALPGGFSEEGERIEETAARELLEETGIEMGCSDLTLIGVYSKPGRDPRGWTVSAAYLAVVDPEKVKPKAADDAADARWYAITNENGAVTLRSGKTVITLADLAFDHEDILMDVLERI